MQRHAWLAALAALSTGMVAQAQVEGRVRAAPAPAAFPTTLRVPEDVATLQEAIWRSSPGGVVVVRGEQEPVVIDRPLSILGDPDLVIDRGYQALGSSPCHLPGVTLAGAGSGVVTLVGLHSRLAGECGMPAPAVAGGGFDELRLVDCSLSSFQVVFSGGAYGSPGVEVDVPLVLVTGSLILGGRADVDDCYGILLGDGDPALLAPQGTVVVLDSDLRGGDGGYLCCHPFLCACPQTLSGLGGIGGDGVVAREVFQAGSTIVGGKGSTFHVLTGGPPIVCGSQPDGVPVVAASTVVLTNGLQGPSRMALGASYTLSWNLVGATIALWVADGFQGPEPFSGGAWSFLPADATLFLGLRPATPASWTFPVPSAAALLRHQLTFQGADEYGTLTRPVTAAVTH